MSVLEGGGEKEKGGDLFSVWSNAYVRDLKKLLMHLFEGIDALLELNVVRWKFSLDIPCLSCGAEDALVPSE